MPLQRAILRTFSRKVITKWQNLTPRLLISFAIAPEWSLSMAWTATHASRKSERSKFLGKLSLLSCPLKLRPSLDPEAIKICWRSEKISLLEIFHVFCPKGVRLLPFCMSSFLLCVLVQLAGSVFVKCAIKYRLTRHFTLGQPFVNHNFVTKRNYSARR